MWTPIALATLLAFSGPGEPRLALRGHDPVALCAGEQLLGEEALRFDHGRYTYRFADAERLKVFRADPERYSIQRGGACARMGPLSNVGNPDYWAVYEGRIYIFSSRECHNGFLKDPDRYLEAAPELTPPSEPSRQKGAAWFARALEAHGGAARVDAAQALVLVFEEERKGWINRVEHVVSRGGELRRHLTWKPVDGSESGFDTTWVLNDESHVVEQEGRWPVTSRAALEDLRRFALREPLTLFWARDGADFLAAYGGAGTFRERAVENLLVRHAGLETTWHLDPESAEIVGLSWRGRAGSGVRREVEEVVTETVVVEGLSLPRDRTVFADGRQMQILSRPWSRVEVRTEDLADGPAKKGD